MMRHRIGSEERSNNVAIVPSPPDGGIDQVGMCVSERFAGWGFFLLFKKQQTFLLGLHEI